MSPTLTTATLAKTDVLENAQSLVPMLRLAFDANKNNTSSINEATLRDESVPYLLKAAAYADNEFRAEIETVLVQLGPQVAPQKQDALAHHENAHVASVAAMVLIRLGQAAENDLLKASNTIASSAYAWRFDFVLNQLRLNPALATLTCN